MNGQFVLVVDNSYSGTLGPRATIGCLGVTDFHDAGGALSNVWTSTKYGPATASPPPPGLGFTSVPDVANGATPLPTTAINILTTINGKIQTGPGLDKATLMTSLNGPTSTINSVFVRRTGTGTECNVAGPTCYLRAYGWSSAYGPHAITWSLRDTYITDPNTPTASNDIALVSESLNICFLSGLVDNASTQTNSVSVTGGHADGKWHLSTSGPWSGAVASCIPYAQ